MTAPLQASETPKMTIPESLVAVNLVATGGEFYRRGRFSLPPPTTRQGLDGNCNMPISGYYKVSFS